MFSKAVINPITVIPMNIRVLTGTIDILLEIESPHTLELIF